MERTVSCILLLSIALLPSCKKDDDTPAPTPVPTCGIAGARLQASFLGESFCPGISLFADNAAGILTINGMSASGSTLTLELWNLDPGSYDMGEDVNHLLFTNPTGAYETSNSSPATLVIVSHDEDANRIQGNFNGPLTNPLGGTSPIISGSFDMIYLE